MARGSFSRVVLGPSDRVPAGVSGGLIVRYLASNPAFEGIGNAWAARLWEALGQDLYRALGSGDVEALEAVVGQELARGLVAGWAANLAEGDVVVWLSERGFDPRLGVRAVRFWGASALERLKENPYVMMALAAWPTVDGAARILGFAAGHPHRRVAAVEAVLYRRLDRGHTWMSATELGSAVGRLLGPGQPGDGAVALAISTGAAVAVGDGLQPVGAHVMERFVADAVRRTMAQPDTEDLLAGDRAMGLAAGAGTPVRPDGLVLNEGQVAAVRMALSSRFALLLGGAGVGKTTVLGEVHRRAEHAGLAVEQMALSGRAAMRMREATGRPARTIAGFLGACGRGEVVAGVGTLLVVDEASMLDLPLLYSILRRMSDGCRMLLVGDPHQLPPIGFGLTFHTFAAGSAVPRVELTEVHRQAAMTGIPDAAGCVRDGSPPVLRAWSPSARSGVSFLSCEQDDIVHSVTDVLSELGDVGGETRVLSPVRGGPAGVEAINRHLHVLRSPGRARVPSRELAVGDPLLFTRNDYGRELYNGSLGELLAVDAWGGMNTVFDGRPVRLAASELGDIELAYCLTVHKAQGSQFRRVVIPVFPSRLLDRALIYTAMTRATEQVVFVGDREAFRAGVEAPPASTMRETALAALMVTRPGTSPRNNLLLECDYPVSD